MASLYTGFRVQRGFRQPRSRQLAEHFRARIERGELACGETLPPAGSVREASRMTVLKAYRQLQQEGLVRMQPSRGTVVIAHRRPGSLAIVIGHDTLSHGGQMYVNQLIASLITGAPSDWQAPRVYLLQSPAEPAETCDPYIPDQLREDIQAGLLRGAFVYRPRFLPGIFDWLADRNVPAVCLGSGPDVPHMDLDIAGGLAVLLANYQAQGLRRIEVWDTSRGQDLGTKTALRARPGLLDALRIDWLACPVDKSTVIATAQELGERFARRNALPDALVITDDWLGMTAVYELANRGLKVPGDLRVAVQCNYGYIPEILYRCDRLIANPDEQARALYGLMELAIARRAWRPVPVPMHVVLAVPNPKEVCS